MNKFYSVNENATDTFQKRSKGKRDECGHWSVIPDKITDMLEKNFSYKEIARQLTITTSYVWKIARNKGLNKRQRKYSLNESFFEVIDSSEKAYFLGLLYSDGYVNDTPSDYGISISLKDEDIDSLEKLKLAVGFDGPISIHGFYKENRYLRLRLYSKKMVMDLIKHGCIRAKSLVKTFPNSSLLPDQISHFVRGYFDGNGGLWKNKDNQWALSFSSSHSFVASLRSIISPISNGSGYIANKGKSSEINFEGHVQIRKILEWMYKNSVIYMNRKYKLFKQFIDEEDKKIKYQFQKNGGSLKNLKQYQNKCQNLTISVPEREE